MDLCCAQLKNILHWRAWAEHSEGLLAGPCSLSGFASISKQIGGPGHTKKPRGLELEEDKNRTLPRQLEKFHFAGSSLNLGKVEHSLSPQPWAHEGAATPG